MSKTIYRRKRSRTRLAFLLIGMAVAVFVLIQFVPYGRDHTHPPARNPFHWTSPQAKAIAQRSCYDCHSNKTKWWWAVKIAPFSWLAQHDISAGRARLNFSEWDGILTSARLQRALGNGMPPLQFTLLHPTAKLSDAEKQTLIAGFEQSVAQNGGSGSSSSSTLAQAATEAASGSSSTVDATALIDQVCSSCHSSAPAQQFRASSAAEAQALIDQMIQQGASVSASQEQKLIDYYTR